MQPSYPFDVTWRRPRRSLFTKGSLGQPPSRPFRIAWGHRPYRRFVRGPVELSGLGEIDRERIKRLMEAARGGQSMQRPGSGGDAPKSSGAPSSQSVLLLQEALERRGAETQGRAVTKLLNKMDLQLQVLGQQPPGLHLTGRIGKIGESVAAAEVMLRGSKPPETPEAQWESLAATARTAAEVYARYGAVLEQLAQSQAVAVAPDSPEAVALVRQATGEGLPWGWLGGGAAALAAAVGGFFLIRRIRKGKRR